jgi:hypothetical protein
LRKNREVLSDQPELWNGTFYFGIFCVDRCSQAGGVEFDDFLAPDSPIKQIRVPTEPGEDGGLESKSCPHGKGLSAEF